MKEINRDITPIYSKASLSDRDADRRDLSDNELSDNESIFPIRY